MTSAHHHHREKTATDQPASKPGSDAAGGDKKRELRGMSFEAGEAALSPLMGAASGMLGALGGILKGGVDPKREAEPVDETSEAEAEQNAKSSLDAAASDAKSGGGKASAPVDAGKAYEQLKAWTMQQVDDQKDDLAIKARDKIKRDYAKAQAAFAAGKSKKDPGSEATFKQKNWFKAYWHYQCKKFAIELTKRMGKQYGHLAQVISNVQNAADDKGETGEVKGRSEIYRGMTIGEVAAAELSAPKLQPGCVLQVKLHWEIDHPYMPRYDFQHWVTYLGHGRFSDTMVGPNSPGKPYDEHFAGWVRSEYAGAALNKGNGKLMYDEDPKFTVPGSKPPKPVPGLLPRVSGVYDPSAGKSVAK